MSFQAVKCGHSVSVKRKIATFGSYIISHDSLTRGLKQQHRSLASGLEKLEEEEEGGQEVLILSPVKGNSGRCR